MLSKKMTVSLTSLIIIFALAFVAPTAMAQVKVTVSGLTSVQHGGTATTPADTMVDIVIETDKGADKPALTAVVFDKNGELVDQTTNAVAFDDTDAGGEDARNTSKKRYITMNVPSELNGDSNANLPLRIVVTIPAIGPNDPSDDTGDSEIMYRTITITEIVDTSALPKVVSIQRLRPGSQTVVAAFQEERVDLKLFPTFDVRIVLTKGHTANPLNAGSLVEVENGTASVLIVGQKFGWHGGMDTATPPAPIPAQAIRPHPIEGMYEHAGTAATPYGPLAGVPAGVMGSGNVPMPNSDDNMYSQYRVTITPHQKSSNFDVKIRVKEFHDGKSPVRRTYLPPGFGNSMNLPNGRDILTVPVKGAARNLTAGYKVTIPKDWYVPGDGYFIIANDESGSGIDLVGQKNDQTNDAPRATHRTPTQLKYNVYATADLPNLASELATGVVIDVVAQTANDDGDPVNRKLYITEVMWGEDVSLDPSSQSQWIELYNPGDAFKTVDDADHTPKVNEALTLIFYAPNELDYLPPKTEIEAPEDEISPTDRIGTLDDKGAHWAVIGKGQSGRSGTTATGTAAERGAFVPAVEIVSMYRGMDADDMLMDGQMAGSWMSSPGPKSANFAETAIGIRHGTPGAATSDAVTAADLAAEAKAKAAAAEAAAKKAASTGTIPAAGVVYISEVMFAGGGTLPQWIEIANGSVTEDVNLSGWTLSVDNAVADAAVSIGSVKFTIPDGTMISRSRQSTSPSTILIVTEAGRNNIDGASEQVINLKTANEVELINAGVTTRKYSLLSSEAFLVTLAPPAATPTKLAATATAAEKAAAKAADSKAAAMRKAATDMAGNLGADGSAAWALPTSDDGRSSILRKHINVNIGPSEPEDGMMMASWTLASDTAFAQATHIRTQTYYGAMSDVGTPGFRAGSALPVELSHFRPARQKDTGAVVITWSTQSELNNAGFFIKRSNQKDGEFKVINATMIAGAGTTSEKQFYTYTDTTAQPNVVYYYQIEDVSLDGNRQTLTRGIRLKGHIGAAGKLTSTWGELKSSNE